MGKGFAVSLADKIALESIEHFANRLMIKYEKALNEETLGDTVSDVGIGFEIAISVLNKELERAREELDEEL